MWMWTRFSALLPQPHRCFNHSVSDLIFFLSVLLLIPRQDAAHLFDLLLLLPCLLSCVCVCVRALSLSLDLSPSLSPSVHHIQVLCSVLVNLLPQDVTACVIIAASAVAAPSAAVASALVTVRLQTLVPAEAQDIASSALSTVTSTAFARGLENRNTLFMHAAVYADPGTATTITTHTPECTGVTCSSTNVTVLLASGRTEPAELGPSCVAVSQCLQGTATRRWRRKWAVYNNAMVHQPHVTVDCDCSAPLQLFLSIFVCANVCATRERTHTLKHRHTHVHTCTHMYTHTPCQNNGTA